MSKNATGPQVDQNREDDGRISQDTATPTALTNQAATLRAITATFNLMNEYVDSCNDQSDETGGLAVVPNFKGFKKFLDAKLEVKT